MSKLDNSNTTPEQSSNHSSPLDWDELKLDLILPWTLPSSLPLLDDEGHGEEKAMAEKFLSELKLFLQHFDPELWRTKSAALLDELTDVDFTVVDFSDTDTAIGSDEVKDFDRYFRVNHGESKQMSLSLIKGLTQSIYTFSDLCCRHNTLPALRVEQQVSGYLNYVELLCRVFNCEADTANLENTTGDITPHA